MAELSQLSHLKRVSTQLAALSLSGNPVAAVPLYREHCLAACPVRPLRGD